MIELNKTHKKMLLKDAKENQDLYANNLNSLGGFEPQLHVDADSYTKINRELGNNRFNNNALQNAIDDEIIKYLSKLKLDPNKKGKFMTENGFY